MLESVVAAESAVQKRVDLPANASLHMCAPTSACFIKTSGFSEEMSHGPRLYVCHQMRLYVCHQIRLLNLQRSSLRSLTFARFARTFF